MNESAIEIIDKLQRRIAELEHWPDGTPMDQSNNLAAQWRSRCLAAEHKNKELLAEIAQLRLALLEVTQAIA